MIFLTDFYKPLSHLAEQTPPLLSRYVALLLSYFFPGWWGQLCVCLPFSSRGGWGEVCFWGVTLAVLPPWERCHLCKQMCFCQFWCWGGDLPYGWKKWGPSPFLPQFSSTDGRSKESHPYQTLGCSLASFCYFPLNLSFFLVEICPKPKLLPPCMHTPVSATETTFVCISTSPDPACLLSALWAWGRNYCCLYFKCIVLMWIIQNLNQTEQICLLYIS